MRNCREFCRFAQICAKHYPGCTGEEGLDPSDCPMAWKIEDLVMDGEAAWKEQHPDEDEYEDEDGHNPTVYSSRAEERYWESPERMWDGLEDEEPEEDETDEIPFCDPPSEDLTDEI